MIDYNTENEVIVTTQAEMDDIPLNYHGQIIIKAAQRIVISKRYFRSVWANGNGSVWANGNSSVWAYGNGSVWANGNSSVWAYGNSSVEAYENSSVEAYGNSSVRAYGNSSVWAYENSSVRAYENSSVEAHGNSSVRAYENSSVCANGNSSVEAHGNSSVRAYENSSVWAYGNSQIVDSTYTHSLKVSGNARIVYNPRNAQEYADYIGADTESGKIHLYKAVHKRDGRYISDHQQTFEYIIGAEAVADCLTLDTHEDCGHGIHAAHMGWCLDYGKDWPDLSILEVEMDMDGIVVPIGGNGKVRAAECKVIREVPLEECGVYGKILAKRRNAEKS